MQSIPRDPVADIEIAKAKAYVKKAVTQAQADGSMHDPATDSLGMRMRMAHDLGDEFCQSLEVGEGLLIAIADAKLIGTDENELPARGGDNLTKALGHLWDAGRSVELRMGSFTPSPLYRRLLAASRYDRDKWIRVSDKDLCRFLDIVFMAADEAYERQLSPKD